MDEVLDSALSTEAIRSGKSKAELIRECVAARYGALSDVEDPLDELVGAFDIDPANVDDVVYGGR
jgi:hypothetical protein